MDGWSKCRGEDRNSVVVFLREDTGCEEVRWVIRPYLIPVEQPLSY